MQAGSILVDSRVAIATAAAIVLALGTQPTAWAVDSPRQAQAGGAAPADDSRRAKGAFSRNSATQDLKAALADVTASRARLAKHVAAISQTVGDIKETKLTPVSEDDALSKLAAATDQLRKSTQTILANGVEFHRELSAYRDASIRSANAYMRLADKHRRSGNRVASDFVRTRYERLAVQAAKYGEWMGRRAAGLDEVRQRTMDSLTFSQETLQLLNDIAEFIEADSKREASTDAGELHGILAEYLPKLEESLSVFEELAEATKHVPTKTVTAKGEERSAPIRK